MLTHGPVNVFLLHYSYPVPFTSAVVDFHARRQGLTFRPEHVIVGPGSKELLFLLPLAFRGDVLVPTPSWVSYEPQSRLASRRFVPVPTSREDGWRLHPDEQHVALGAVLDEVGWVQNVIVNQRTGVLVDGHLRVKLAVERKEPMVPVLYVDLSEAEESTILAALDPIAGLAQTDANALNALLDEIHPANSDLSAFLDSLRVELEVKDKPVKAARQRNATQIIQEKARRARATAKGADDDPVIAPVGDGRPLYACAWDALPGASPVALEHHRDACRWPIEVPGAIDRACNEPTDGGRYCAHHHALGVRAEAPPAKRTTAGKIKAFNL